MSALTVDLPDDLHRRAIEMAASKDLSIDALVAIALAQSLSCLTTDPLLEERAARATGKGLQDFLSQAGDAQPSESDQLPENYSPKY